ncbi:hypothetical protein, partial [Lacticaseibacillus paracasei]|uniref:hypothetical protein n=1 Tax=Lacticaseibacillus paracasei TaxID=1597 RepID=UPI00321A3D85
LFCRTSLCSLPQVPRHFRGFNVGKPRFARFKKDEGGPLTATANKKTERLDAAQPHEINRHICLINAINHLSEA